MKQNSKSADKIYKMLAFQYAPLEKMIKQSIPLSQWKKFDALPSARKICLLDNFAADLGIN